MARRILGWLIVLTFTATFGWSMPTCANANAPNATASAMNMPSMTMPMAGEDHHKPPCPGHRGEAQACGCALCAGVIVPLQTPLPTASAAMPILAMAIPRDRFSEGLPPGGLERPPKLNG